MLMKVSLRTFAFLQKLSVEIFVIYLAFMRSLFSSSSVNYNGKF